MAGNIGAGVGGIIAGGSGRANLSATLLLIDGFSGPLAGIQRNIADFQTKGILGIGRFGVRTSNVLGEISTGMLTATKAAGAFAAALAIAGRGVASFDKEIAGIAAITGKGSVLDPEIQQIRSQAIQLSKEFAFSATEIAKGQLFVAQAGADANQTLAVTPQILQLATATMESFDLAAKLTIKTLNVYGLSLGNIADTTRVVNDLQFAVNRSVNTLQTLSDSLKFAAPFTSVLGISLEDLSSALILTANAGVEAGIAGRSIGQGLQQLVRSGMRGATKEAQLFAAQLSGIIDGGGTIADITRELESRFGILTDSEKIQVQSLSELDEAQIEAIESGESLVGTTETLSNLIQVFGVRGARIFGILLGQSDRLDEFRKGMELQVISAADAASVALENLGDQAQIALQRIQAGILESNFADVLFKEFEKLNKKGGTFDDLGDALGDALTEIAQDVMPALIDSIQTFATILKNSTPALELIAETVSGFAKILSTVFKAIPDDIQQAVITLVLFNKVFNISRITASLVNREMMMISKTAGSMGAALRVPLLEMRAFSDSARIAKFEVTKLYMDGKIQAQEFERTMRSIEAQQRINNAQFRQQGIIMKANSAIATAGAAAGLGLSLFSASNAQTSGDVAFNAIGGALSGAFLGATIGSFVAPGVGTAIGAGIGGLVGGGVALGFGLWSKSKNAKKAAKDGMESFESALEEAVRSGAFAEIGNDIGKQIGLAIMLASSDGISQTAENLKKIFENDAFISALENVQASGGRLTLSNAANTATILTGVVGSQTTDSRRVRDRAAEQRSVRRNPLDLFAAATGLRELGFGGQKFRTETTITNQFSKTLTDSLQLQQNASDAQVQAALNNGDIIRELKQVATAAFIQFNATARARGEAEISFEDALQLSLATLPEELRSFGQVFVQDILGEGFGNLELSVITDENGNKVIQGVANTVSRSLVPELKDIFSEVDEEGFFTGFKDIAAEIEDNPTLISDAIDAALSGLTAEDAASKVEATLHGLEENTRLAAFSMRSMAIQLDNSVRNLAELNLNVAKAGADVASARLNVTRQQLTGAAAAADFLAVNGVSVGKTASQVEKAQQDLLKIKALQIVVGLRELQFNETNLNLESQIKVEEFKIKEAEAKVARENIEIQRIAIEQKRLEIEINRAILEALIEQNLVNGEFSNELKTSVEGLIKEYDEYVASTGDIVKHSATIDDLLRKVSEGQTTIANLVAQQGANYNNFNKFIKDAAAALGLNLQSLTALDEATLLSYATMLYNAELTKQLTEKINGMLSGANALGQALIDSEQAFVQLGFSAKEIDDAIKQFKQVQFLNSMFGFLNNFQDLANSTGNNLALNDTIKQVQKRLLTAGDSFLKELLDVTDPETFAEILARESFVEQNISKTTVINLQADLIFPENLTAEDKELISKVALDAVNDALNSSPLLG